LYILSSLPFVTSLFDKNKTTTTLESSKIFWRTVFIASGLVSLFVFFSLFGDDGDASELDDKSKNKYRGRRPTHNLRKRRNDNKASVDEKKPGDVNSDSVNMEEAGKCSYTDSNPYWTGEYSYSPSIDTASSPLNVQDLDAKPNLQRLLLYDIKTADPTSFADAVAVIRELKTLIASNIEDVQDAFSCAKAERLGRQQAERRLEAEILVRKHSDDYLTALSSTINQQMVLFNRQITRQQDAHIVMAGVESQLSTLLDKLQLSESGGATPAGEGLLRVHINMDDIITFEELLKRLRERREDLERTSEDDKIEYASIIRRSKDFSKRAYSDDKGEDSIYTTPNSSPSHAPMSVTRIEKDIRNKYMQSKIENESEHYALLRKNNNIRR